MFGVFICVCPRVCVCLSVCCSFRFFMFDESQRRDVHLVVYATYACGLCALSRADTKLDRDAVHRENTCTIA